MPLKVAFHTFGCKLNQVETEAVAEMFAAEGFEIGDEREADLFFVNTCAVTGKAEAKSRRFLRKLAEKYPGRVIAAGCYAQAKPLEAAALAEMKMVLGTAEKYRVVKLLENASGMEIHVTENPGGHFIPLSGRRFRSRAFVKIQDGCDHGCSYCIVPVLRGGSVSLPVEEVICRVKEAVSGNSPEIVLTGVDVGSYRDGGAGLSGLLEKLISIPGLVRIRLSSIEPPGVTGELIEICAGSAKICNHFHLPLQAGSDKILRAMGRGYTGKEYLELTEAVRSKMPDARIGADVVAGFPGEEDADFEDTFELVKQSPLTHIHVFPFSVRPGTVFSEKDDMIPHQVKAERAERLRKVIADKNRLFIRNQLGRVKEVYFEESGSGFTDNYIRVSVPGEKLTGFHAVKLVSADPETGRVIGERVR